MDRDTSNEERPITPPSFSVPFQVGFPLYTWPEIRMIGNAMNGARTIRNAASTDSTPAIAKTGTIRRAGISGISSLYSFPESPMVSPSC